MNEQEICEAYKLGENILQLQSRLRVSRKTIRRVLARHRIPRRTMEQIKTKNRKCSIPGCGRHHQAHGYCSTHYDRLRLTGCVEPHRKIGDVSGGFHPCWKGGRVKSHAAHILVKSRNHPMARSGGYVFEHRLVMEKHLGRLLTPKEVVHHKLKVEGGSGRRDDNRIENLTLFPNQQAHAAHHRTLYKLHGKDVK